jgi:PAS domain S-box-containing protein
MSNKQIKILLIEDNPGDVRLIREMLAEVPNVPWELKSAERLSTGLDYLAKQQPDIILLDLGLPDSQGIETLKKIYAKTQKIPIVVLTGIGDEAIASQAVREGAQDYLSKGDINGRVLWRVIRYAIERKQAEEALYKEKQFAESLIDTAQAVILVLDTTGRIVSFNRYMEEVSGYHLEEVKGRDWFSKFLPEDDQHRTKVLFSKSIIDGIQNRGNVSGITTKDGRIRDIEWYDKPLKDEDGNVVGLLAIGQDVTERKKLLDALAESELWYRHMFDNAPFGIGFSSIDGKVINLNKAMETITGYSADEFNKINLADLYVNKADREALLQEIGQHGGVIDYPAQLRRKDGTPYDVLLSIRLTTIGNKEFLQTIYNDVTERKKAEESLSISERNFRDSIENSPLGIRIVTEDGKSLYANRAFLDIYGYSSLEELEAVPRKQRYTHEGYSQHQERKRKRKRGEDIPADYEISIVRKDGQVRELAASRREVLWNGEKQFQVLYQDITERKQAEEALRESEQKYRLIAENASDIIWTMDMNLRFTYMSPSVTRVRGYTVEEVMPQSLEEVFTPSSVEAVVKSFAEEQAIESLEPKDLSRIRTLELELTCKNGSTVWCEVKASFIRDADGQPIGILGAAREITERRKAEEALRQSEKKYRTILEDMDESYYETDLAGNFTFFNDALYRHLGYSKEELMGMNYLVFTPPEDVKRVSKASNQVYRTGKPAEWFPREMIRKDGRRVFTETSIFPLRNEGGEIIGWRGVGRDVTKRKQAEQALRESEERYRTLFDATADGILIADLETRQFQYANPAICRMLGYTEEELRTMDVAAIHPKEDLQRVMAEFEAQVRGDKTLAPELPCLRKDGTIVYADVNAVSITIDGKRCNAGFFRDITERKKAEQQALVNAKLASVGELVAGVAHEVNNPLTGILGYAQLLADRNDVPQSVKEDLQKIYEESRRTVKIVQNLLRFARQYKPEKNLVDINELLERTLELEDYKMRTSNIMLSTKLVADLPLILADYNQLQQVVLNIVTNAQQAIAETNCKGKIKVTTDVVEDYVRISISDNGPGISPENITRIFDPFFTTKQAGSGSGLGLSVCHGIITEHGGNIYAESTRGRGTTFIIELPIATGEQAVIKEKEPAKKKIRQPRRKMTGNILIAEDEPSISAVLTRNLLAKGYQVQAVPDGKAALNRLTKNSYDLLIFDLKMPGVSGRELYETMKKNQPKLAERIVFITGDVMSPGTHDFLVSTGRPYLIKPFDSEDIIGVIDKVFNG